MRVICGELSDIAGGTAKRFDHPFGGATLSQSPTVL